MKVVKTLENNYVVEYSQYHCSRPFKTRLEAERAMFKGLVFSNNYLREGIK